MLKRIFTSAVTAYVIMLLGVTFALTVALRSERADIRRNREVIAQVIADRDEARITSCYQFNETERVQISAETHQIHDLITALVAGTHNPATIERVAAFYREHDALIVNSHPLRDCTAGGIARYLAVPAP